MSKPYNTTEVFKALSDPIRWNIVQQIGQEDEFACSLLEDTLPVSKTTISYHAKILTQAGLIDVRKRGRNYFYTLRREVLAEAIDQLWALAPGPRPIATPDSPERHIPEPEQPLPAATSGDGDVTLLTW
jgi:DNA-binding transcriptional ArsR family regulator